MATKVLGQTSGKEIEVSRETAYVITETGAHTLVVTDNWIEGTAHLQLSLFGFKLPIPLKSFRNVVRVNIEHPEGTIWTGNEDRTVIFEAPS